MPDFSSLDLCCPLLTSPAGNPEDVLVSFLVIGKLSTNVYAHCVSTAAPPDQLAQVHKPLMEAEHRINTPSLHHCSSTT